MVRRHSSGDQRQTSVGNSVFKLLLKVHQNRVASAKTASKSLFMRMRRNFPWKFVKNTPSDPKVSQIWREVCQKKHWPGISSDGWKPMHGHTAGIGEPSSRGSRSNCASFTTRDVTISPLLDVSSYVTHNYERIPLLSTLHERVLFVWQNVNGIDRFTNHNRQRMLVL